MKFMRVQNFKVQHITDLNRAEWFVILCGSFDIEIDDPSVDIIAVTDEFEIAVYNDCYWIIEVYSALNARVSYDDWANAFWLNDTCPLSTPKWFTEIINEESHESNTSS